MEKEW